MPRASPTPQFPAGPSPMRLIASKFPADQWRLLVRLPAETMIAAVSIRGPASCRTVPEGLTGLDAIAAGRSFDSDLVRAVVAAIFAEPEDRDSAASPGDPAARRAALLADCNGAVQALRDHADPADGAAYRHWVQQVAVRVCRAPRSGPIPALGDDRLTAGERTLLAELAAVLS